MFLMRNCDGVLVDLDKAVAISKCEFQAGPRKYYCIQTKNDEFDDESGYLLGKYDTREKRDKVFDNLMMFLDSMDMKQFEEDEK